MLSSFGLTEHLFKRLTPTRELLTVAHFTRSTAFADVLHTAFKEPQGIGKRVCGVPQKEACAIEVGSEVQGEVNTLKITAHSSNWAAR